MKKILSFLAAGALALGLIGCSGDLHDKEISPLYIEGTCWTTREALEIVDDTTQKISFTYTGQTGWDALANEVHFKVITTPSGWTDDFGGSDTEDLSLVLNGDYVETHSRKNGGLPDTKHIVLSGLDMDTEYTIYIQYVAASNKVSIKYEGPDSIPTVDMSILYGSEMVKMDMTEKNKSYTTTVDGTGSPIEFKVFNGTDTYGVATAGSDVTDNKTKFVRNGKTAKATTVAGIKQKFDITVTDNGAIEVVSTSLRFQHMLHDIKHIEGAFGKKDLDWNVGKDGNYVAKVTFEGTLDNAWWSGKDLKGKSTEDVEFGFGLNSGAWTGSFRNGEKLYPNTIDPIKLTQHKDKDDNPDDKGANATIIGVAGTFSTDGMSDNDAVPAKITLSAPLKLIITSTLDNIFVEVEQGEKDTTSACFANKITTLQGALGNYSLPWVKKGTDFVATVKISGLLDDSWWIKGTAGDSIKITKFGFGLTNSSNWENSYRNGETVEVGKEAVSLGLDASGKGNNATLSGVEGTFSDKLDSNDHCKINIEKEITLTITSSTSGITIKAEQAE